MFSNLTIGFLAGLGISAWVYSKMIRSTGGNTKNALIVAAVAGVFAMAILVALLSAFIKK